MPNAITAQQVVDRIQKNLGAPWKAGNSDVFHAGAPETPVTGIVTTYAATMDVLRRAVTEKKNMIVSREAPYWDRADRAPAFSGSGAPPKKDEFVKNPTYRAKQEFIENNKLVIWRFSDNWQSRKPDGQLRGLAMALGWDKLRSDKAGAPAYHSDHEFFVLPSATLKDAVKSMSDRLKCKAIRVIGDPQTKVSKVALTHGFFLVPALQAILKEPGVDAVVVGEPVEWEASPYFQDVLATGQKKAMIVLGQEVSEEPGSGEVAAWLKTFIAEVPVEWIPAGEPFWVLK